MDYLELVDFRDNVEKIMECPVCLERLKSPVSYCRNGHVLCPDCHKNITICPLCKATYNAGQHTFINQMISLVPFKCKYSTEGCEFRAAPAVLDCHEKICDYRYIDCPLLTATSTACVGLVSLQSFPKHIEQFHQSYITAFSPKSWEYAGVIPKITHYDRSNCYYSVLRDSSKKFYFIVMIYYEKETKKYQISVHYLGKTTESNKFIFTIQTKIVNNYGDRKSEKLYCHTTSCAPNIMPPDEVKKYDPFELNDTDEKVSKHQDEIRFLLKIRNDSSNKKYRYEITEVVDDPLSKKRKTLHSLSVPSASSPKVLSLYDKPEDVYISPGAPKPWIESFEEFYVSD